ncbi:alpha-ketoglutarate-dependent dioxygenase AlkB [Flavobacterium sp.]|uniref:alpha-ketoglutarate-dependent dioxygenase AlkB n=1 Tax=Flavobacterium sp. TaxID=239 RepID=UPI00286DC806|nr:alpha-ketoglutarate-dependent dioxygenase AlkB [Flavobacterium sp.]
MEIDELIKQIVLKKDILSDYSQIVSNLKSNVLWDNSINSRKTASFGIPYNYSNVYYLENEFPDFLNQLVEVVNINNGFIPNNCLINFYFESTSKMGYHSDQIDILYKNTGIAIFSFGSTRVLRFKSKNNKEIIYDVPLENNSFFYMSQEVQNYWLHSILPDLSLGVNERFSLTFRKIIKSKYVY